MIDHLPEDVQKQVSQLSQWVEQQPNLPKNIDKLLIVRFLHSNYYDMEKAKATAQLFFNIRTSLPELISNRDPLSAGIQRMLKILNVVQIRISGNRNLWIWQLNDPGLENYDYVLDVKLFFLVTDAWILDDTVLQDGDIIMMDVKDVSLKFLTKLNYGVSKSVTKYQEEAIPIRLKGVHVVNASPTVDKIFAVMKVFMKQELANMINFHTPNSPTLFEHLSKDDLPEDFGGNLPKLTTYLPYTFKLLEKYRDQILDDHFWRCDKIEKVQASTEVGTFRKLDID